MPVKEAGVRRDYGFDYTAELGTDTITASAWIADDGLTLTGETFDATKTSVFIEGGIEGQTLTATNRVTTFATRTYERVLTLIIRAAVDVDDDYLLIATELVREIAPVPDVLPVPPDYYRRAAAAERLVANYLQRTEGGIISSQTSVVSVSISYQNDPKVLQIIRDSMGKYVESNSDANSNVAFVSRGPI